MKRYLILLFFTSLFFEEQINAQSNDCPDCMSDSYIVHSTTIDPFCGTNLPNECDQSYFDATSVNVNALTPIDGGDWMLIIDEGFDATLDSTLWLPRIPWSNDDGTGGYLGVHSLEIPENLSVYNGKLHLRGKYDNNPSK